MNKNDLKKAFDGLTPPKETLSRMEASLKERISHYQKPKRRKAFYVALSAAVLLAVLVYPSVKLFSGGIDTASNQTAENMYSAAGTSSFASMAEETESGLREDAVEESEKPKEDLTLESAMLSFGGDFDGEEESAFSVVSYEEREDGEGVLTVELTGETEDAQEELKALAETVFLEDPSLTALRIVWTGEEAIGEYLYDGVSLEKVN